MRVEFTKMDGAGNDFVLVDNRGGSVALDAKTIARICNRRRGVGADGLILLNRCESGKADYAWSFYNSDGSSAEMCGNGARCFAHFIQEQTGASGVITFETISGIIRAEFVGDLVKVGLTQPVGMELGTTLDWCDQTGAIHSVNTGVPHAVYFVEDVAAVPVQLWGKTLRNHSHFAPRGTNVNFVQILDGNAIRVRTYERGVEGETLACGTGVTASALIAAKVFGLASPVRVRVQSGDELQVGFNCKGEDFSEVTLTGPARHVFTGWIEI